VIDIRTGNGTTRASISQPMEEELEPNSRSARNELACGEGLTQATSNTHDEPWSRRSTVVSASVANNLDADDHVSLGEKICSSPEVLKSRK